MDANRFSNSERSDADSLCTFLGANKGGLPVSPAPEFRSRSTDSNTPRICVVTETYPPEINGVALTLANLVKGLLARGHAVSVVHPKQRNQHASDEFVRGCGSDEVLVRGLPLPGYQGLQFGVPAGRHLRRSWRHSPPAVVYVATEGPLGWSAVRAAKSLGIPIVSGFHTNFHHYCKHYGVGLLQHTALRYLRWFHNQTECTLVSNEELRTQLQKDGFNNVSILDRGVDSELFDPQRRCPELRREWGVSDDDIVQLCVGRIAAEKNLEVATAAFQAARQLDSRIKLVIVGDGPLRFSLQREHPEVIFAGTRTGEQLARYYASADLFLFPSETETFGNVTLEAMASGLVVIAYNYAGAKLHISHGETGVLVSYGETKGFIESVCGLMGEREAIRRMRLQARQYVTDLNWPRVVERFEALLMSAGGRPRPASPTSLTRRRLAT